MTHLDNSAAKTQHERWKAARARMRIGCSAPVIAYQRPLDSVLEPIQAPTKPRDAAARKRAAERERVRQERAERIQRQIEADRLALESARSDANQRILGIILATSSYFVIPPSEILSDRKTADVLIPRQVAMYLAKELTPHSYPNIGRRFRRDHTSVLHSVRKIEGLLLKGNPKVTLAVAAIKDALNGNSQNFGGANV